MSPAADEWTTAAFLDEATAFVAGCGAGLALTGEREHVHVRPWSRRAALADADPSVHREYDVPSRAWLLRLAD